MNLIQKCKRNAGFTLVELIVVIAILAILAGVAVPAYSGYIKKAESAADQQLIGAVNTAFQAACLEEGKDVNEVNSAVMPLTGDEGSKTVDLDALKSYYYGEAFARYYAGNENSAFKTISSLAFDAAKHVFVDPDSVDSITLGYGDTTVQVSGEQLAALKGSVYVDMGASGLLGKVDYVTNLAATLMSDPNSSSTFVDMIKGPEYGQILAGSLGIDMSTEAGKAQFVQTVGGMVNSKMDALIASGQFAADANREEGSDLYNAAYNQIVANNAVLHAAKNSEAVAGNILTVLGTDGAKGEIVKTINANSGQGLSQAAMAYGLYTAYAQREGISVSGDPSEILNALDDDGFQDYINNVDGKGYAQSDLDGYMASMTIINSNVSGNTGAVSDILVDGFANEELITLLGSVTGK